MSYVAVTLLTDLDDEKTYSEREYEKQVLHDLFEVVKLRDNIVNSIEVDRQRSALYLSILYLL